MALTARVVTIDCADPASLAKPWVGAAGDQLLANDDGWHIVLAPSSDGVAASRSALRPFCVSGCE